MLRNTEITDLMSSIVGELMPLSAKRPNNELWLVYHLMQEWKFAVEWKHSAIGTDRLADIAHSILMKLETLPNHELAQAIELVVKRHTLLTLEGNTAACGRVIPAWQINNTGLTFATTSIVLDETRFAERPDVVKPAVR